MSAKLEEEVKNIEDEQNDGCAVRQDQDVVLCIFRRVSEDRVELWGIRPDRGGQARNDILWLG